jgi:hypothetical protein
MAKTKAYEAVIAEILKKLDEDHAKYQARHMYYYGEEDIKAKHIHKLHVDLCTTIRREIALRERK